MDSYLQPTKLCDFDVVPEIKNIALTLTAGVTESYQKVNAVARFVKEIKYAYDEWYVPASSTLITKEGMCSSKTNLMVAMLRSIGIPSRYRIFRVKAESELFNWLMKQDKRIEWASYNMSQQYHVITEVLLGNILAFDTAKDTAFEHGLRKLGIPVEIETDDDSPLVVDSFDDWAHERYLRRISGEHQPTDLSLANRQLDRIRQIGVR
jgi:transglutaminase-like putative cysteine protease